MKVGDAVRFIGFEGYREHIHQASGVGVIVEVHDVHGKRRYSVSWPNGTVGNWLYAETLEIVSESR